MTFNADKLLIVGLVKITLPSDTIRLCDGGFVYYNAEKYTSFDPDFGSIIGFESFATGVGDEAPGGRLVFAPVDEAAAAALSNPAYQGSPMVFTKVTVNEATGAVTDSEVLFSGMLDVTVLNVGRGTRTLDMEFVAESERLFSMNEGNTLSARHHKLIWPGELGLDNAIGVGVGVSWGTEAPPRGVSNVGGGGGGGVWDAFNNVRPV